jgi:hypothetical protein
MLLDHPRAWTAVANIASDAAQALLCEADEVNEVR